jgi:hypothetical protein
MSIGLVDNIERVVSYNETREKYSGNGLCRDLAGQILVSHFRDKGEFLDPNKTVIMSEILPEDVFIYSKFKNSEDEFVFATVVGVDLKRDEVIVYWKNTNGVNVSSVLPHDRGIQWRLELKESII